MKTNSSQRNPTGSFIRSGAKRPIMPLLLVLLCAGITACSNEPNREITFAADKSGSTDTELTYFDSPENVIRHLEQQFGVAGEEVIYYGCRLRLCAIGASIRPQTLTITLDPVSNRFLYNTQKRKNEIATFKKQLSQAVQGLMNAPANQQHSQIYHTLCAKLTELEQSDFGGSKQLIVLSDGLESTLHHDFIQYGDKVDRFREMFPQIKKELAAQCSMPNLSGVSITMVNSPQHVLGDLILACDDFWKEVISDSHGKLIIKSNLNS